MVSWELEDISSSFHLGTGFAYIQVKMKAKPQTLNLPGKDLKARSMPLSKKKVNILWDETPLAKAAREIELEKIQGNLFKKGGE
jgi:hypothetical protein